MDKNFLVPAILLSAIVLASPSHAKWTDMGSTVNGRNFYVDFTRVQVNNGYVYVWVIDNYLKPDKWGDMSSKILREINCTVPRKFRIISAYFHTQPMGEGNPSETYNSPQDWEYPPPESMIEGILRTVCKSVGK